MSLPRPEFQMTFVPSQLTLSAADLALISLLLCAMWSDLRSRKIPNVLILAGLAIALVIALMNEGFDGVWFAAKGAGLGLTILLPFFVVGVMGAGDVKLLAAVGAYSGVPAVVTIALLTFIAGGVLGVVYVLRVHGARRVVEGLKIAATTLSVPAFGAVSVRLPYAVAMLCGSLIWMVVR